MSNLNGNWILDASHTEIKFIARHAMITKVRGEFTEYDSNIVVDVENQENSSAKVVIKTASLTTGNGDRDGHVKGEDFFDVEKFPEMTFVATAFNIKNESEGTVTGDLTVKETTKSVTLDVEVGGVAEDPFGNTRLGFEATTEINRKDFGLEWNAPLNTGGVLVSEKIKIEIDGSAIKQA
ncbi:YceI family protein [uncultured Corynebacterium sp.]|uniref:YceI family protein n=1 Tax=uncultured Corynebacterium sp. TaxID=159447 RepID=UPI0025DEEC3A|nr:YceI family protein [uncultured Corynebacterium sp.]